MRLIYGVLAIIGSLVGARKISTHGSSVGFALGCQPGGHGFESRRGIFGAFSNYCPLHSGVFLTPSRCPGVNKYARETVYKCMAPPGWACECGSSCVDVVGR